MYDVIELISLCMQRIINIFVSLQPIIVFQGLQTDNYRWKR